MPAHDAEIPVGLVGFGLAGRVFHAPVIRQVAGLRLTIVVERHGDHAANSLPGVRTVRTVDQMLADPAVRLVVVATPNASHASLARQCLEQGRDVVVDKPFAPSSEEAASIVATAERHGRIATVFHNRRWDGDFLTLRRLLAERRCGRVVRMESRFDRFRPARRPDAWRERPGPGAGLLFDLGPHLVDQAVVLFGAPDAVTGDVRIERDDASVDDAFDVVLHYPSLRVCLGATMLAAQRGPRFVVNGTAGSYVKYHLDPQEERLSHGETTADAFSTPEPREWWGTLTGPSPGEPAEKVPTAAGDYRRFYENVRDAIRGVTPLEVTPQQALDVVRILELARESSRAGRTLPLDPRP
jgi:predicted dehydrogenase